jgi:hypothetical protein
MLAPWGFATAKTVDMFPFCSEFKGESIDHDATPDDRQKVLRANRPERRLIP